MISKLVLLEFAPLWDLRHFLGQTSSKVSTIRLTFRNLIEKLVCMSYVIETTVKNENKELRYNSLPMINVPLIQVPIKMRGLSAGLTYKTIRQSECGVIYWGPISECSVHTLFGWSWASEAPSILVHHNNQ